MHSATRARGVLVGCVVLLSADCGWAQDWPQWRGPNRDARAAGFQVPAAWPKELTQKWKVPVGDGVATPALVGDRLYVFSRQEGNEVTRCLHAASGNEVWQDKYEVQAITGPAGGFQGPRSSPTVAEGKVLTLGARGTLSCFDAAKGTKLWRKNDFQGTVPRFFTSCSPIVVNGLCVVQLGGENKGGIVAYDLTTGDEKWKWDGDGTAYASPVLFTLDGSQEIVAETAGNIVGLGTDGKLLWKVPFAVRYNACTPVVDGSSIIFSGAGKGLKAVKVEKQGAEIAANEAWSIKEHGVQFNTPVVKNGLVFGISERNILFCVKPGSDQAAWTTRADNDRGYGSVVDAGPVLLSLTPGGKLVVFEPTDKEYKEIASYKVGDGGTFAYPVLSGNRLFIKDKDSLILYTIE